MADVKWIKIVTDIFDDEKIMLIDQMPERDAVLVIWFKLLCLAGRQNNGGVLLLCERMPYTDEMLATIFRRPLNTVRLALQIFETFGMVEIVNNVYTIPNWEKHQAENKMEEMRENNRKRVAAHRERQRMIAEGQKCNVTVTQCNGVEEKNEEIKQESNTDIDLSIKKIVKEFNTKCKSFSKVSSLTEKRKSLIRDGLKNFNVDDYSAVFEKAEELPYLKGNNPNGWKAHFDWIIKPDNMVRIIEGVFDNRGSRTSTGSGKREPDQDEILAIQRMIHE